MTMWPRCNDRPEKRGKNHSLSLLWFLFDSFCSPSLCSFCSPAFFMCFWCCVFHSLLLWFLPLRREKSKETEFMCSFVCLYSFIEIWATDGVQSSLSCCVSVCVCVWTNVDTISLKKTEMSFETVARALLNWLLLLRLSLSTSAVCFYAHRKYTCARTSFIWTTQIYSSALRTC